MPFEVIDQILNSGMEKDAVLTTASGFKPIKVIYRNKYKAARISEMEVGSVNPYCICRSSDLADAKKGDMLEDLEESALFIDEIQPQGDNKTILQLKFD
jgi:hypothetical protein